MPNPKNAVVVLLDSLNRHMLGAYGASEFETPHIDRFAKRAVRFEKHFVGSLPCMPARHDILCGALDFLWKPWGSIELWEAPITQPLRAAGVTTMLVSDHPHLFETGGENYHTDFRAWDYVRGHENDPWRTVPDPTWTGAPSLPARDAYGVTREGKRRKRHMYYDESRTYFRDETDFPGPRTMSRAAEWVRDNAGKHERFMLFVDEFDPHEPFDTPKPWATRYDPDWTDPLIIWPPYTVEGVKRGVLTEREARQLRANYGSKLSMIDHWFGRLLDTIDSSGIADDTAIILCTDHGHYLGEKDIFGKPIAPHYEPIGHTPLMIAWPGVAPGACGALTTNVDIHATLADLFGVTQQHRTHGKSLVPLLDGSATRVREWALAGIFGRWVHVIDEHRKYARAPVSRSNTPLSMWSNRWSTMPVHSAPEWRLMCPDRRAKLDYMPGSDVPVIRQPFEAGDPFPFWCLGQPIGEHHCYRLDIDPEETENRLGDADEEAMVELLRVALREVEAPEEQLRRLGIA